jgi:hypothetical protein
MTRRFGRDLTLGAPEIEMRRAQYWGNGHRLGTDDGYSSDLATVEALVPF